MIDFKHRAFTAKIINNGQHPKASAVEEVVRDEIHGPVLIDSLWSIHDHPEVADALPAFLQAQRETFFTIDALGALMIDQMTFPAQQSVQPGSTELTPLFCKFA
jgi:hypothetical protein